MIDTFYHRGTGQRLSILDYDQSRTNNVRYRAVINDDQTAVLHLQSVDIKDSHQDVSQLSLCPGVLESEVLQLLSQAPVSNTLVCVLFLIEKLQEEIVYRSRNCHLLCDPRRREGRCFSCRDLLSDLRINASEEKPGDDLGFTDLIYQNDDEDNINCSDDGPAYFLKNIKSETQNVEDTVKPVVIRILKEEGSVPDIDRDDFDTRQDDDEDEDQGQNYQESDKKERNRNFKCPNCPEKFTFSRSLVKHAKMIHDLELNEKKIKNENRKYQNKNNRYKKTKGERKWSCPECPFIFYSQWGLVKHASREHGVSLPLPEDRQKEKCPFCEETFYKHKYKLKYSRHLQYSHPDKKEDPLYQEIVGQCETRQYICQDCGRSFPTNRTLEEHMVALHGSHVNTLPCHICGIFLKTQQSLDHHLKRHHISKPGFVCSDCGKTFTSKTDMVSHFERIHSDTKYSCKECGSEFRAKMTLKAHIRRSHGKPREKPETCTQCQKNFYTLANLKKHISDVHDKIKAFHCEECQFQCARMDNLNLHRRKSHNKQNITKTMLISMVENDQHPFYTAADLEMIKLSASGY